MAHRDQPESRPLFAARPSQHSHRRNPVRHEAPERVKPAAQPRLKTSPLPSSTPCTVFAANLSFPWRESPVRRGWTIVTGAAIALGAAIGCFAVCAALGAAISLPRPGWAWSGQGVEPANGEWLGFQRGGGRLQAADNACALLQSGRLLEPSGFDCGQDRISRSLWAFYSNHETWSFRPRLRLNERHCLALNPERVVIDLVGDAVARISVSCRPKASAS
jgi:hypothetical protein